MPAHSSRHQPFSWLALGLRCLWLVAMVVSLLGGVGMGAEAIGLGDDLSGTTPSQWWRQGDKSYPVVELSTDREAVTAVANSEQKVFQIQVQSTADLPPDPANYLGSYAGLAAEVVGIVPLRGKTLRYSEGSRTAVWTVYGMSGNFVAQATSLDLAPPELVTSPDQP
ncbi:MAG: hypothetical protein NW237_10330 [Cyanobacteriota bacterium]|nr:hypothetical protein [Cyanobacteriota bacterium]